jgi:hypothetical protein
VNQGNWPMTPSSKLALLMLIGSLALSVQAQRSRQEDVAQKGATVMPFDLSRTQHFFDENSTGGVETITTNDKHDAKQEELIRSHLRAEARRFGRGDFSDPGTIHGRDMPGLQRLAAAGSKLKVSYSNVPSGASITFSSEDASVVRAIHEWFAAQRSDHGAHGHMHH